MFYGAQQNLTGLKSFTVLGKAFQGSIKLYGGLAKLYRALQSFIVLGKCFTGLPEALWGLGKA